jgi:hypothetical protein
LLAGVLRHCSLGNFDNSGLMQPTFFCVLEMNSMPALK